jgi:uncharacterized protein (TIGR02246 family)
MRRLSRSVPIAFLAVLLTLSAIPATKEMKLPVSDRTAIQGLLERFRNGWLSGKADVVRSTFASDAVLMPHHGVPPVVGMAAINEFWWPASSAKTTITRFTQTIDEIDGEGKIAYVRGRSEVAWSIEDHNATENWKTGGNFMALLRKQSDGSWLMSHLIWDDPPNQRTD